MKRAQTISWIVLLLAAAVMTARAMLPDWAVRVDGVLMLLALPVFAFTTVRIALTKK